MTGRVKENENKGQILRENIVFDIPWGSLFFCVISGLHESYIAKISRIKNHLAPRKRLIN